jgi:hypothetical protein
MRNPYLEEGVAVEMARHIAAYTWIVFILPGTTYLLLSFAYIYCACAIYTWKKE